MNSIKKEPFIFNFMRQGIIPHFYQSLFLNNNKQDCIYNDEQKFMLPEAIIVNLFPDFLIPSIKQDSAYNKIKIRHSNLDGAGIFLKKGTTIDDYLKGSLKKNVKRYINRLESCFKITFEYNYGFIEKDKCDFLLNSLHSMMKRRFAQNEKSNHFFNNWENYIKDIFLFINNKKASLFVIYQDTRPISISLNFHYNERIMFSDCASYDIDYEKFGLGHIDLYKHLEWCLENNYAFLDLGNGVSEYKSKWCNIFYNFHYFLYYKKKSIFAMAISFFEFCKISIKNFLLELGVKELTFKLKSIFKKPENNFTPNILYTAEDINNLKQIDFSLLKEININEKIIECYKKPIFDFLYLKKEHIKDVQVFKINNENGAVLLKGKHHTAKIIFKEDINSAKN